MKRLSSKTRQNEAEIPAAIYTESKGTMFMNVTALAFILLSIATTGLVNASATFSVVSSSATEFASAYSSQRKIVRTSNGDLYVISIVKAGEGSRLRLMTSSDDGATWVEIGDVPNSSSEAVRPSIAVDSRDRIHIAWTDFRDGLGQIFYRIFDGSTFGEELQITSSSGYQGFPSIAVDSKDIVHLVWYGFDGQAYQVFYSRVARSSWTNPVQLSHGFPDSVNPSIAVDADDRLHVVYFKSNGKVYQVYYAFSANEWSQPITISSAIADSYNPTVAISPDGAVHVAWDKTEEAQSPNTQIFYAKKVQGQWSPEMKLTRDAIAAENPSITIAKDGTPCVYYNKRDGGIYRTCVSRDGSETRLKEAEGRFPSVRWSFLNNHQPEKLDLIWTQRQGGNFTLFFTSLKAEEQGQPIKPPEYLMFPSLTVSTAAIALVFISALILVILHSRSRKLMACSAPDSRGFEVPLREWWL